MSLSKQTYWENVHTLAQQYIDKNGADGYKQLLSSLDLSIPPTSKYGFYAKLSVCKTLKSDPSVSGFPIYYATYSFYWSDLLVASSPKGVCFLGFIGEDTDVQEVLQKNFPNSNLHNHPQPIHLKLIADLEQEAEFDLTIHLIGTAFQLAVWDKLLELAPNEYVTYKDLAQTLGVGKAYQAVGSAVGMNPISLLIPCHQVLSSSDKLTGYRWGVDLKLTLLMGQKGVE